MDYSKYVINFALLIAVAFVYEKFKNTTEEDENIRNYRIVNQYLVNDSSLAKSKLPIAWIYMDYEQNTRWWQNFYSRNTDDLNQPYLYLTIKSIIDHCGGSFNVCLIDDDSLVNIIPGWNIEIHRAAKPIKGKLRELAKANILKYYGGVFIPPSFLCLKNLQSMYYSSTCGGKMFVGEMYNKNITSTTENVFVSTKLIGSHKNNPMVDAYIDFLQQLISTDSTSESIFDGSIERWIYQHTTTGAIRVIPANHLGCKDHGGKIIVIDNLIENSFIDFDPQCLGIYFPQEEILERTAYQWFARLSAKQAIESDTVMGKLLLTNCTR